MAYIFGFLKSIGEQGGGGGAKGVLPPLEKKFMTPPLAFKMTPTPSEMAFDPPTQISSFLSWRRFFLEKKKKKILEKKFLEKKFLVKFFSPADAGASFGPKKPKSAIKNVSPAPLSTPLRRFFMTPP